MTNMKEYFFDSCGKGKIHVCSWEPSGRVKGVVQIVHGIAEYAQRYEPLAAYLNSLGFLVVAEDHMGHGKSVGEECTQGYFCGGWFSAVNDTYQLLLNTQKEYPGVPYVIFGHSMGSFLVRTMLIQYPDANLSAAIICGTGWMSEKILKMGGFAAKTVCRFQDETKPSKLLHKLMFGSYNKRIKKAKTPFDWLSCDEQQVQLYIDDPLCGFMETAGLARDMLEGILFIQDPDNIQNMNKNLPVYFIAGGEDPVGDYGVGVRKAVAQFKKSGMKQVSCKIYNQCRHEIHNELKREEVFSGIGKWIEKALVS